MVWQATTDITYMAAKIVHRHSFCALESREKGNSMHAVTINLHATCMQVHVHNTVALKLNSYGLLIPYTHIATSPQNIE